jgi:hypothetical protein
MAPDPSPAPSGGAPAHPASEVLRQLAGGSGDTISFAEIADKAGPRVHGLALLLLVLPETLPLPLPSASLILAIPLMLISLHLALFGEGSRWPRRLETVRVSRAATATVARYVAPVLAWFETISHPRMLMLARRERLIGMVCLYLSLILFLPLPLVNAPPGICLALIALGLIQHDGLLIGAGLAGTIALTIALAWLAVFARGLLGI